MTGRLLKNCCIYHNQFLLCHSKMYTNPNIQFYLFLTIFLKIIFNVGSTIYVFSHFNIANISMSHVLGNFENFSQLTFFFELTITQLYI